MATVLDPTDPEHIHHLREFNWIVITDNRNTVEELKIGWGQTEGPLLRCQGQ